MPFESGGIFFRVVTQEQIKAWLDLLKPVPKKSKHGTMPTLYPFILGNYAGRFLKKSKQKSKIVKIGTFSVPISHSFQI